LGDRLAATLSREGVGTEFLARKPLSDAIEVRGARPGRNADYAFYGANAADRDFQPSDLTRIPDSIRVVHFSSGSTTVAPIATTTSGHWPPAKSKIWPALGSEDTESSF
jgi:hypothetical protein